MKRLTVTLILLSLSMCLVHAQLSSNPNKFLGNITTGGSVNGGGIEFKTLWNQLTAENESKWQSIEGSARNSFNWGGCDNCYNYAKQNGIPFKFHTLIWGAQYPSWMDRLSTEQQYKAIIEWFDAVKKRYPDLPLIDVVNEAVPGHQPAPYREALGGEGVTGYDWIIKGANCNIDKITFNCVVPSDIEAPAIDDEGDICDVYTPDGIHVGEFALQSPLTLGSQLRAVTGERGIFIVRHRATGVATRHFVRE